MKRTMLESKIHGAAAHLIEPHDLVIISSCVQVDEAECRGWEGGVVFVDEKNVPRDLH
jgi:aspartate 1-decarboxylase